MQLPHLNRYILCRYVAMSTKKSNKIPLNPSTLHTHNPLDPSIHMDYQTAHNLSLKLGEGYGVGFVIMQKEGYFFIDLDNCLTEQNTWNELALNTLTYFPGAFIEVSHSGRGLHIIGRYEGESIFDGKRLDSLGVEIYTAGRFCALTQINAQGNAESVHTESLTQYIEALGISTSKVTKKDFLWVTETAPGKNVPEDNAKIIEFILSKPLNQREVFGGVVSIRDLWENNVEVLAKHYPTSIPGKAYDYSAADAALAYRLLYFSGGNCDRALELMQCSKLKREKWDISNYLPRTISNARGIKSDFFTYAHLPQALIDNNTQKQKINNRLLQSLNYPELSSRGKVLDTSTNLKFLLDIFGISTRWNNMKRKREVNIPKCELFIEDAENFALMVIKDLALNNDMPILRIDENLDYLAQKENYHPIVEGLVKNPWDGRPRLDDFIATLETVNPTLSYKLMKRWMVSAIAAVHSTKGFASHGVLVLAGEQNIGKTRFIKALDPFDCEAIKTGATLDPKDKDCIRALSEFWIAELGELDGTFRKSDIARLKSYLTEDLDKIRLPYARRESILKRRTVFAATVNDPKFLIDDTGNRRWWTLHVLSIKDNHGLDMLQVWAEVFHLWNCGEQTWITPDEFNELNAHNKIHEQINPLEELLHTFFDFSPGWEFKKKMPFSATEVLRCINIQNPSKYQCAQMGKIITKTTGVPSKRDQFCSRHYLVLKSKRTG